MGKKLACAAATVAAALDSVSVYRMHAGAAAAREQDVVMQDTMKVRGPHDKCSDIGKDCTESHCCKGSNVYCWRTDVGTGMCQQKSNPGWPGEELEGMNTIVPFDCSIAEPAGACHRSLHRAL